MSGILILAPDPADQRFWSRIGDAFDTAMVEVVRTLDAAGDGFAVLAPWTDDLAPLMLAAMIDTAPGFDPEGGGSAVETRSRVVPYRPRNAESPGAESVFWRASGMSLTREAAEPLQSAVAEHRPGFLLVLGLPEDLSDTLVGVDLDKVQLLTFGSLVSSGELAERLNIPKTRVRDLERELPETAEPEVKRMSESALERSGESELEPYVPYGLLLQAALEEYLPGEELEDGGHEE